ncbi:MAG: hypothetical protein K0R50_3807 [Eubacterium sp.]|jgi:hypothetical protein|nr:hypothetical protein [Eubacterium sp.]
MIYKPLLNILLVPIVILAIAIWKRKDVIFTLFAVPNIFFPIFKYSITIIVVMIPFLLLLGLIETIGNITAQKDEGDLEEAFDNQDLRNRCPILMNIKRIKGSDVTMREFYSSIPLKTWTEKMDNIADSMSVHFVEKIKYGGRSNGKRIVLYTTPGRESTLRGKLYDDEL